MFGCWRHNFFFLLVPPQLSFSAFRNFIVHKLKERCVICKKVHRNGIGSSKNDPFVDVRNLLFALIPAIAKQSATFDKTNRKTQNALLFLHLPKQKDIQVRRNDRSPPSPQLTLSSALEIYEVSFRRQVDINKGRRNCRLLSLLSLLLLVKSLPNLKCLKFIRDCGSTSTKW